MKHSVVICDEVFFVDVIAFYLYAECFHHFVCLFLSDNIFFRFVVSIVNATYLNPVCAFFSSIAFNFNEVEEKQRSSTVAHKKQTSKRPNGAKEGKKPKNLYSKAQEFMLGETIIRFFRLLHVLVSIL